MKAFVSGGVGATFGCVAGAFVDVSAAHIPKPRQTTHPITRKRAKRSNLNFAKRSSLNFIRAKTATRPLQFSQFPTGHPNAIRADQTRMARPLRRCARQRHCAAKALERPKTVPGNRESPSREPPVRWQLRKRPSLSGVKH